MKKPGIILTAFGLLCIAWLVRDLANAAGDAVRYTEAQNVVEMYDSRHGSMPTDKHDEYVELAWRVCDYLDTNPSLPDAWNLMVDNGMSSDAAATTIEAAITYLCTEHKPLLET